jgi:hypothetical protein
LTLVLHPATTGCRPEARFQIFILSLPANALQAGLSKPPRAVCRAATANLCRFCSRPLCGAGGSSGKQNIAEGMAANTIRINPPFCITKADTDFIIKTLDEAFSIIEKGWSRGHVGRFSGFRIATINPGVIQSPYEPAVVRRQC